MLRRVQSAPKERSVGKQDFEALRLGTLQQDSSKTFVVTHEKTTVVLGAKETGEAAQK